MNLFIREMKAYRKSLIIWSAAIFFVIVSAVGKFSAYAETGQSMNELLSQIPRSIKAVLGMGNFDLTTVGGFYGMFYLYLLLMGAIHASILGANIISKEERDKTVEFLMVKPISRERVITEKLLAALINVISFNLVTLIFSILLLSKYSDGEDITGEIIILMTGMLLTQFIFLLIGTGAAALSRRPKSAVSEASAILLGTFILSSAVSMSDSLENLKYLTPFQYFEADSLLDGGGFQPVFLILTLLIIAGLALLTYAAYKMRDLNI